MSIDEFHDDPCYATLIYETEQAVEMARNGNAEKAAQTFALALETFEANTDGDANPSPDQWTKMQALRKEMYAIVGSDE